MDSISDFCVAVNSLARAGKAKALRQRSPANRALMWGKVMDNSGGKI